MITTSVFSFFAAGNACSLPGQSNFLALPYWYKYLSGVQVEVGEGTGQSQTVCTPQITSINDTWLIVAAVIEILIRLGALIAIGFIIYGGIKYTLSQGEPDQTAMARNTIINAVIGLVIAVIATAVVAFVAGRFTQ